MLERISSLLQLLVRVGRLHAARARAPAMADAWAVLSSDNSESDDSNADNSNLGHDVVDPSVPAASIDPTSGRGQADVPRSIR